MLAATKAPAKVAAAVQQLLLESDKRSSRARFRRARNARPGNGWTAFRVSLQVAFGHLPGLYAFRGLLASALRAFP